MSDNILFDNIIITDDKAVAERWAAETFDLKRNLVDKDQVHGSCNSLRHFPNSPHIVNRT